MYIYQVPFLVDQATKFVEMLALRIFLESDVAIMRVEIEGATDVKNVESLALIVQKSWKIPVVRVKLSHIKFFDAHKVNYIALAVNEPALGVDDPIILVHLVSISVFGDDWIFVLVEVKFSTNFEWTEVVFLYAEGSRDLPCVV